MLRVPNKTECFRKQPVLITGFAVFVIFCFSQTSLEASCGDYLAGSDSHSKNMEKSDEASLNHSAQQHPLPIRSPCENGKCQRSPGVPPAPAPVSFTPDNSDQWGTISEQNTHSASPRTFFPADRETSPSQGHSDRIDRPPQSTC